MLGGKNRNRKTQPMRLTLTKNAKRSKNSDRKPATLLWLTANGEQLILFSKVKGENAVSSKLKAVC
ncbi:hypothetical protein ACFL52_01495 [Candidatus Margulisiibacteriota bacterium]